MSGGYVETREIIRALKELRNAVEMGQFRFKPGSRGQEEAARALAQANEVLERIRLSNLNDPRTVKGI